MLKLSCPNFTQARCNSCPRLGLEAELQIAGKFAAFRKIAEEQLAPGFTVKKAYIPESIFPSRAKAKLSVSGDLNNPCLGIIDNSLKAQELLDCPLHLPILNQALLEIKALISEFKLFPYDIQQRKGELKGLILRCNRKQDSLQIRFILRSTEALPRLRKAGEKLKSLLAAQLILSANIQSIPHAILEGPEEILLSVEELLWESYNGLELAFTPQSFSQITPSTAEALYAYVRELAVEQNATSVLDLFCGVGGFSLHLGEASERVYGVELSATAIKAAKTAAARNKLSNVEFSAGDAEELLKHAGHKNADLIICNPPRRGLAESLIKAIQKSQAKTLLYSSCNPLTLFRDIKLLSEYKLISLRPFEMFPLTEHLEVVAELKR